LTAADAREADRPDDPVVVIGGDRRLTAAFRLARPATGGRARAGLRPRGISRTVERDGWRFDIGGHRFFTKVVPVEEFWHEILPDDDFLLRPRMSRIFYGGKYYDYRSSSATRCRTSASSRPSAAGCPSVGAGRPPKDLSTSRATSSPTTGGACTSTSSRRTTRRCGRVRLRAVGRLGAQRIKACRCGTRLGADPLVFGRRRDKSKQVTSLIEEFQYPKFGPG